MYASSPRPRHRIYPHHLSKLYSRATPIHQLLLLQVLRGGPSNLRLDRCRHVHRKRDLDRVFLLMVEAHHEIEITHHVNINEENLIKSNICASGKDLK